MKRSVSSKTMKTLIQTWGVKMKVNIGTYKKWIGPYQIADAIFFVRRRYRFNDDTQALPWNYRKAEKLGDWLSETWFNNFCLWLDSKRKRKIKIKIHRYDTWSMDHTLALIIHPMLLQIKEKKQGSPSVDDEDVPENIRSTNAAQKKSEYDTDEFFHARWAWVLDEMIFAFEHKMDEDWADPFYERKDYDGMKEIDNRIQNGLRLFGKYYSALWD
jgi:hypothetical protein